MGVVRAAQVSHAVPGITRAKRTRSPAKVANIDFGNGESVKIKIKHQPDMYHILHSVGVAGVRRKGANGFPVHESPIIRDLKDINVEHEYVVWPVARREFARD